jgi:hypothetical protein
MSKRFNVFVVLSLKGIVNWVQGSVRSTAVISTVLLGTAGTLQAADTTAWRGKTLAVAVHPPSRLDIEGLGAMFILGATHGVYEPRDATGGQVQADYAIEDPALRVARKLFLAAQQQYEVVAAPDVAAPRLANPKELTKAAQGADLLLDVFANSNIAKGFNGHYWVGTNMDGRIIDVRDGKVVSTSFCKMTRGGDPDALTYDELIADDAARLKAILARQADACLEKFKAKVLSIH